MSIIKTCTCGREYTLSEWLNLPAPSSGVGEIAEDYKGIKVITVFRNCVCKSTGIIEMTEDGEVIDIEDLDTQSEVAA